MEVILLEKIANLGDLGDKVNVKAGYGRNYLLPQRKAAAATAEAERVAAEEAKASARASAITKLAALGLTEEEAAALVGPNPQS